MSHEITSNRRHIVLGILAHVDAGKTTLSESLLYLPGRSLTQDAETVPGILTQLVNLEYGGS